jgi:hypothetical protein
MYAANVSTASMLNRTLGVLHGDPVHQVGGSLHAHLVVPVAPNPLSAPLFVGHRNEDYCVSRRIGHNLGKQRVKYFGEPGRLREALQFALDLPEHFVGHLLLHGQGVVLGFHCREFPRPRGQSFDLALDLRYRCVVPALRGTLRLGDDGFRLRFGGPDYLFAPLRDLSRHRLEQGFLHCYGH